MMLLGVVISACHDVVDPGVPSAPRMFASTRASVVTPSGVTYTPTDLGSLGGNPSVPIAINEAGQIAGSSALASNDRHHAFRWESGVMTDLGTLGGINSFPFAMNASGVVVGYSYTPGNSYVHPVKWEGATITDLGTLPDAFGGYATAINDRGVIVGISFSFDHSQKAFIWENGVMTELPSIGGTYSWPVAINNNGEIVGYSYTAGRISRAVRWHNGAVIDLGSLSANGAQAVDINDAGQITGIAYDASWNNRAFRWENGVMTDLGTLGGASASPTAINAHGDVVGYSTVSSGASHAALWRNGVAIDLGAFRGDWSAATDINDRGQVTGWSQDPELGSRTFLWENGVMTDLGTIGGSFVSSTANASINNRGQIVGVSQREDGSVHATLWDPSDPVLTVAVDIKPGSSTNALNPKSKGLVPVAILSVNGFDATTVAVASVRFGPGGAVEAHGTGHVEDVNGDGVADLVMHFDMQASGIACGATSAALNGQTNGGRQIRGSDAVTTAGCK
jgi:probable HAF family extracellular repeat protein